MMGVAVPQCGCRQTWHPHLFFQATKAAAYAIPIPSLPASISEQLFTFRAIVYQLLDSLD
jgi:hypothetical protein